MDTRLKFDTLCIIEWLDASDRPTGKELADKLRPLCGALQPPVTVRFEAVASKDDFLAALKRLRDDVRDRSCTPVLHIETHGVKKHHNDDYAIGIGTSAGTVCWHQLMGELLPINVAMKVNLFVFLAACRGMWGIQMLQPTDRAAFRALIGPDTDMHEDRVFDAALTFHETMFRDMSAVTALAAANAVIAPDHVLRPIDAETAFKAVFQEYLASCSPDAVAARQAALVNDLATRHFNQHGHHPSFDEMHTMATFAKWHISNHSTHFEKLRQEFFCIDLYPENDTRFDLSFDEFKPLSGQ